MRIRIVQKPTIASVDGIRLDGFEVGVEYEAGNTIAALLLAEGWAEPVAPDAPRAHTPFDVDDPFDSRTLYPEPPTKPLADTSSPFWRRASGADATRRRRR